MTTPEMKKPLVHQLADGDVSYIALLESHDYKQLKWVPVPAGQSLDFDDGTATRRWLYPHLGSEWHLLRFVHATDAQWRSPHGVGRMVVEIECQPSNAKSEQAEATVETTATGVRWTIIGKLARALRAPDER